MVRRLSVGLRQTAPQPNLQTEEGYVRVAVRKHGADRWELEVTDSGPGISREARSRLFKPFELAEDPVTREHAGAGLGLSITKQLVEVLGGEIVLQSQPGQGSTFTVLLPVNLPGQRPAGRHR